MISFLIALLLFCVVIYVINLVLEMLTLPPQVKTIVYIIVGLIGLFYLLSLLGLGGLNTSAPVLR